MIDTVVEVLVIKFLVGAVQFPHPYTKTEHDVLLFHHWSTVLRQAILFCHVCLARVKWTKNNTAGRVILE